MGTTNQIVQGWRGGILRKADINVTIPSLFQNSLILSTALGWGNSVLNQVLSVGGLFSVIVNFLFPNPIDPQEGRAAHLSSFVFSFFFSPYLFYFYICVNPLDTSEAILPFFLREFCSAPLLLPV